MPVLSRVKRWTVSKIKDLDPSLGFNKFRLNCLSVSVALIFFLGYTFLNLIADKKNFLCLLCCLEKNALILKILLH